MEKKKTNKTTPESEYQALKLINCQETNKKTITPITRLREFVNWTKSQGLCRSEYDFERQCNLSPKYITNNSHSGKGNIGTEMLGRIIRVYPQLNLAWLCTGEGAMVLSEPSDVNADYKQAYEGALMQIEALSRIIRNKDQY